MKHSDSFINLAAALAKAQATFAVPIKSKSATVTPKSGGSGYTYTYADLSDVFEAVRKGLSENGLSILSLINLETANRPMLETILMHESGEWISMLYPIDLTGRPQDIGGQLTYARRYSISCMLGVASEDDDDANAAQGNQAQTGRKPQQSARVGSSSGTTTQGTTTQTPSQPAPKALLGNSSASTTTEAKPTDQQIAIAFWRKWADKLKALASSDKYPEHQEQFAAVKAVNGIKTDTPTQSIIDNANRLMLCVVGATGEIKDELPVIAE